MPGIADQVKGRLDVVEVVSERVALKKAGKTFKGLCPFHSEKTPSFIVFPESGTWHCFGCGAGGDIFTFVMQSRNVDFGEALTVLASRAGVDLQADRREQPSREGIDRLYEANEAAATYFRTMLAGPAGSRARSYLDGRDVSAESLEAFELGFAPDSGAGLAHHLLQQGFGRSEVLEAGLAGESESGGLYDRFRARLIFPIRDANGKLVGFGGRALASDAQPKYLNTPQTPIFDKGANLYAIHRSRQEIRQSGQAVIVEGYVDALMAHQYGFRNVVASMGTSLTDRQVGQLKRMASELCFALDPDVAGQEATARGLSVAMESLEREVVPVPTWKGFVDYVYKLKTTIKIIALPSGRDPDEVIRHDPEDWRRLVREAVPVQDFFLERVRAKHDLTSAAGKAAAVEEAMAVIGEIPEAVQQAHYVQRLATIVGVDEAILLQQVRRRGQRRRTPEGGVARPMRPVADAESYCMALLLRDPALVGTEPTLREEHFTDPAYREIFRRLLDLHRGGEADVHGGELIERLGAGSEGPIIESLQELLELQERHPVHFEEPEKAYRPAVVSLLLAGLAVRKQQLDAMREEPDQAIDAVDSVGLARLEQQIAVEAHRLKLLGGVLPLRAIHKEVRHGG